MLHTVHHHTVHDTTYFHLHTYENTPEDSIFVENPKAGIHCWMNFEFLTGCEGSKLWSNQS